MTPQMRIMADAGDTDGRTQIPRISDLLRSTEAIHFDSEGMPAPLDMLRLYALGWFPMGDPDEEPRVVWVQPRDQRPVLPVGGLHVSHSLARSVRRQRFEITADRDFAGTIDACAARSTTWLSKPIRDAFLQLHAQGFAHSVEARCAGELVGGLYGLALGSAFIGESMFSWATDASKVALVHLVARLRYGGFDLLDAQQTSDHMLAFGAVEIPHERFLARLAHATGRKADFAAMADGVLPQKILQLSTQMS